MENIFNHNGFDLTSEEVKLLADSSAAIYQREGSEFLVNNILVEQGWKNITLKLAPESIENGLFTKKETVTLLLGLIEREIPGEATAGVFQKDDTLILAFRGTDSVSDTRFWFTRENRQTHYELFDELITNLNTYVGNNENGISKVLVTGHSLGGVMTEIFLENYADTEGVTYSGVSIASPSAGEFFEFPPANPDRRILNIGFRNDLVYGLTELGNVNSEVSTTGTYIDIGGERNRLDFGFPTDVANNLFEGLVSIEQDHHQDHYAYAVNRIIDSEYYDQIQKNSLVIIDRSDSPVEASTYPITPEEVSFILGEDDSDENNGNDTLIGSDRSEIIEGLGGNDILEGGADDDRLDGGDDNDTAVFSDNFENYKYEIDPTTEEITFTHVEGTQTDGSDTLTNVEFAQFSDRLVPLPLEDGPEDTEKAEILNLDGEATENVASLTLPTYTYDGDANYTFSLSSAEESIQYNFAFIIDISNSMDTNDDPARTSNNKLVNAQAAYTNLTNFLAQQDIASEFAVIPFNDSARLFDSLSATQAISTIDGLSADGNTNFTIPLQVAIAYFNGANPNDTNIAYFLSDGQVNRDEDNFSISAAQLQEIADVRAFGIGNNVNRTQLDIVDSGNAVLLSDSSDLEDEFATSGFNRDDIARIDIILDTDANDNVEGEIVETIQADDLVDDALKLKFTGSIEGLDVAIDAENLVTAEVIFNDGRPSTTVDFTVTAGQGIGSATDGNDDIRMSATEIEVDAGAGDDKVLGNYLDNTIRGGSGNDILKASDGDDTIIPGEGDDQVDGGEGIDTVVYSGTREEEGGIRQVSNFIEVGGNTDTLTNVEFVEFSDVTVNTEDLSIVTDNEESSNVIDGTDEDDSLIGSDKNDVLVGYDGNDTLEGLDGEDELDGGMGDDSIEGGQQNDSLYGRDGEDTLRGSGGEDELFGGDGNDELKGSSGDDRAFGEAGNDILFGGSDNDELFGDDDDDTLFGGIGSDSLDGGSGNDRLLGVNSDTDELFGRSTIDVLTGGSGSNTFVLGEGENDVFYDSGIPDNLGTSDYALITDFQLEQDSLELAGSRSDYSFGLTFDDLPTGLAVYHQPGSGDRELIAVLQSDNLLATSEDIENTKAALNIDNFVDSSLEI